MHTHTKYKLTEKEVFTISNAIFISPVVTCTTQVWKDEESKKLGDYEKLPI